jgi:hypothetical protein
MLLSLRSYTAYATTLRTVALSGQQAPGTEPDVNYRYFLKPALNDNGQTAFIATLQGNGVNDDNFLGIWSEGSGNLQLTARSGNQAPGLPAGEIFNTFDNALPTLNDVGQVAFHAWTSSPAGPTGTGIWCDAPAELSLVVDDSNCGFLHWPLLNNAGQVAFFNGSTGIWIADSGIIQPVFATDNPAPGTPSGVYFGFSEGTGAFNDSGKIVFLASLYGTGVDTTNDYGIWSGNADVLNLVAREGDDAPGAGSGVTFGGGSGFDLVNSINSNGQVLFRADLSDSNQGIWLSHEESLSLVALSGTQAPGMPNGVQFTGFYHNAQLNNAGQMAFHSNFTSGSGIWTGKPGNLSAAVVTGIHAPGTPDGVTFSGFGGAASELALNNAGQIAFFASTNGPAGSGGGIWATEQSGAIQLIARNGELLEVAPGDFRTISRIDKIFYPTAHNFSTGFNDLGQVAFEARFTDGTSGVFVSNKVAHGLPGDFNGDLIVDAADYVAWRKTGLMEAQYGAWRANFGDSLSASSNAPNGAVPEPSVLALLLIGGAAMLTAKHRYNGNLGGTAPRGRMSPRLG